MKYILPLFLLFITGLLLVWINVSAQPIVPDDPPPTYTLIPQCAAWLNQCATPFFEIVPEPEYWPTALSIFNINGITITNPLTETGIIVIRFCAVFHINLNRCLIWSE